LGEIDGKKFSLEIFIISKKITLKFLKISSKSSKFRKRSNTAYLTIDGKAVAVFGFKDKIKENAKSAIKSLQNKGIEIIMMTGDNEATAKHVAESLGIKKYFANCLPQDKINEVKNLQNQGKIVAMTGDGINDAPALAQANVGIAMGTGTDIAMNSQKLLY
jgi:Cu2+-exporting ATPase